MATQIICRQDDFDFRLEPKDYINIHEEFIKRGLTETAVLQFAQFERLARFPMEIVDYLREAPNWDLQLHGWQHANYGEYDYQQNIKELAAALFFFQRMFGKLPTTWFTPWNCYSSAMQEAADYLGIKIDNESYDIAKFIREVKEGTYQGHSFYFHGWNKKERDLLPEALDIVKLLLDKEKGKE